MQIFTPTARHKLARLLNWGVDDQAQCFLSREQQPLEDAQVWFIVCQVIKNQPNLADKVASCFEGSAASVLVTQARYNLCLG